MIYKYIQATANLYGIIDKDKLIEIYNSQNERPILEAKIDEIIRQDKDEFFGKYGIAIYNDTFAGPKVSTEEYFKEIIKIQTNKSYYIPEKEELLKYSNYHYFDKNKEYEELLAFIKSISIRKSKAEAFCIEIQTACRSIVTFFNIMLYLSTKHKFLVIRKGKAAEFTRLLKNLRYNTRVIEFNGHTPEEMKEILGADEVEKLMTFEK